MRGSLRRISTLGCTALVAAAVLLSCKGLGPEIGCAGVGYWAVDVTIRNSAGDSIALGATVSLDDGAYHEVDESIYNPLEVLAADERGGRTYDIHVTKPFYNDVWVRGVHAPGGGCVTQGVSVTVPVVLTPAVGAPAMRSIHLLPPTLLLDRAPHVAVASLTPYVDAAPGVSRAVLWQISGDTASMGFDPATGRLSYRCRPVSGKVTVVAVSVSDPSVSASVSVAVQGHPADTSDPPCA